MTSGQSDLGSDLLALATTVLTRLEPILRQAAESLDDKPAQGCSWCPVCALAALLRGEHHDLIDVVASEGAVVIALLRQLLVDHTGTGDDAHRTPAGRTRPEDAAESEPVAPLTPTDVPESEDASSTGSPDVSKDTKGPTGRHGAFVPITVQIRGSRPVE